MMMVNLAIFLALFLASAAGAGIIVAELRPAPKSILEMHLTDLFSKKAAIYNQL